MKKLLFALVFLVQIMPAFSQSEFEHPWKGKRVAYFGDSITDPRNKGSKIKYWGFLENWLNITPYVYGVSGRQWDNIPVQAEKLKQEHGNDFDAITIFMGTNDFNEGIPIGNWYIELEDSVLASRNKKLAKRYYLRRLHKPSMNKETLKGRINIAISKLKQMWPDKQIVVMTPIHRAYFYGGENNIQPTEEYQNTSEIYFDEYVKTIKEAGNIWAIPIIDINSLSGLYPIIDEGASMFHDKDNDRLHPNDKGHQRLARTLYYQLATIPCTF